MSGTIPGADGIVVNKTDKTSCLHGACILVGETDNREDQQVKLVRELQMLKQSRKGRGVWQAPPLLKDPYWEVAFEKKDLSN